VRGALAGVFYLRAVVLATGTHGAGRAWVVVGWNAYCMKKTIQHLLIFTGLWIVTLWFLLPAGASWYWGRNSLVRFDPQVSRDYNCIFVEGHAARRFRVTWFSPSTPVDYLRIRYTPLAENQAYGTLFIDPRTLAYEAQAGWASQPVRLAGKFDSPQVILDWLRSQPNATQAPSHTNDARELFEAIGTLGTRDLEHFNLSTNYAMKNFVIGHQSLAKRDTPRWSEILALAAIWVGLVERARKKLKTDERQLGEGSLIDPGLNAKSQTR